MQTGKQFERLQLQAIYKLRSKFHAQTLSNEFARISENKSLRRPEIFKLSRQLLMLRDEHKKDRLTGEQCRRAAMKILESFPSYSVDEDPQFVCSLRILRVVSHFRGSLLENPPLSVRLALQHHTAHTFLWDPPAAVGFVSVLPSLANTLRTAHWENELDESFGKNAIGSSALVPDLTNTMKVIAPRVYQLASQFTPSEALAVVAAFGSVDESVANAEQSNVSLLGAMNPAAVTGLALENFAPSPPIDFQPPLLARDAVLGSALSDTPVVPSSSRAANSLPPNDNKSLVKALSTVSLMCEDHRDAGEMCRFVYYSAAINPAVGATHLLCLQNKLSGLVSELTVDDIVALCRCVSRTRRVGRRLMNAVGRKALLLLHEMTPDAIGDVLNAFQMANLRHLPLIRRCATRQLMLLEEQTPESVAPTLAAMAHFGVHDELVFSALGRRIHRMKMDGTLFASVLHSCATAGILVPHLLGKEGPLEWFTSQERLGSEELTSNIAIVLWSLMRLHEASTNKDVVERANKLSGVDSSNLFHEGLVLRLIKELGARFVAKPAMAKATGATDMRMLRQAMVIDGCTLFLASAEKSKAEGGALMNIRSGGDLISEVVQEAKTLLDLLRD